MRGIKIPLQDFALKMQGRARGGIFVGHYGKTLDPRNSILTTEVLVSFHHGKVYLVPEFEHSNITLYPKT